MSERAMVKAIISLLAAMLLTACNSEPEPLVTVSEARVIALPTSASVYFTLANSGGRDRLLSVAAEGVGKASLHETSMDGDIMRMRAINGGFEIPARGRVRLSANGKHVMIQEMAKPLVTGSSIRLTLRFERQGEVAIEAPVGGPR
ncbi:MAG: copper chaperone PCu(A)C [Sphingomonas bacterium]|nr:copper chaperone PCu(A)C [Sphingomonas bacterium]